MAALMQTKSARNGSGLIIDTAANLCAVAVFDIASGKIISKKAEDIGTGHAEVLMGYVEMVIAEANISIGEIKAVGTVIGPGSFTGIRVGVSTARGLALALGVPSLGISTLDALAKEAVRASQGRAILVVIDARRGEFYTALYAATGETLLPAAVSTLEQVRAVYQEHQPVLVGSGALSISTGDLAPDIVHLRATADIATYAMCATETLNAEVIAKPKPLYLRAPDAKPQAGFVIERR